MDSTYRLRLAAETAQWGLWGWLLDGLEMSLPKDPDQGGEIPVAVANLLNSIADSWTANHSTKSELQVYKDVMRLADLIIGDTNE